MSFSNIKDLMALYTPLIPAKAGTQVFFVTESELPNPSQAAENTKKPGSPLERTIERFVEKGCRYVWLSLTPA